MRDFVYTVSRCLPCASPRPHNCGADWKRPRLLGQARYYAVIWRVTYVLESEIKRRRTFAIISHPDAGKTTLTEKFLLYGGAIAQAGQVMGKKNTRAATSDWMEIEKHAPASR